MRHEFSPKVRREALLRSGAGNIGDAPCEAVGTLYGLEPGQRCNAPLNNGFDVDHYPIPATDRGSNRLENAVACCKACHRFKTSHYDIPMQAKGKRVADRHMGIRAPSRMRGPGFAKRPRQHTATRPISRKSEKTS